jgi:hypothetical protein
MSSADLRTEPNRELEGVPHTGETVLSDGYLAEPQADDFDHAKAAPSDPHWYKRAVFYEVLVRAFHDHDGNGTGDLIGLTAKLDYLEWLGIDCLWLPPFYASPLRDGGYDISDFRAVLLEFGTVEDFVDLLNEAHKRGIRVITDLVMNHTSDQHPWFQESGWISVSMASGWMRCPTSSRRRAPTARTCPVLMNFSNAAARWLMTSTLTGCCWPRPTNGPPTWWSTSATPQWAATKPTWPFISR